MKLLKLFSWTWPRRYYHLQLVMGSFALVGIFLFSVKSKEGVSDEFHPIVGRITAGRKMSAMDEDSSDINKLLQGQPTVEVYKLSRRAIVINKEQLKAKIQREGFVIPLFKEQAPPSRNRTVTEEDIKKTLRLIDGKLDEQKNQLKKEILKSPVDFFQWDTTAKQRILLITSWRSGSTFLGEILSSYPGIFNHYEPFMHYGTVQIRDGEQAESAMNHLKDLLHCQYNNKDYNRKVNESMQDMVGHNSHVWDVCQQGPNINTCKNTTFLQNACHKFPILTSKIVRLRLSLTRALLDDPTLEDMKIIYLVRDPRGTMNSRLGSVKWCSDSDDCINPARLCDDIDNDLDAFENMSELYPSRLALIKYETLAAQPKKTFQAIFNFAGLLFPKEIEENIVKHTSRNDEKPWSTIRKSTERISLWKTKLDKGKLQEIQGVCTKVLSRLGLALV